MRGDLRDREEGKIQTADCDDLPGFAASLAEKQADSISILDLR